jgi:hypothetical protein
MGLLTSLERVKAKFALRGRFVDYWTIVHLAAGLVAGYVMSQSGRSFDAGLLVASMLFIAWECVEPSLHRMVGREFPEQGTNQVTDVVIGATGYAIGYVIFTPNLMVAVLFEICDFLTR